MEQLRAASYSYLYHFNPKTKKPMATFIPQKLDVKRIDYENQSYIVELDGAEYPVHEFAFQVGQRQPESLNCLIEKDDMQQVVSVKQDVTSLLQTFYHVGQSYLFRVANPRPVDGDHYELEDERGLKFNLYQSIPEGVSYGQSVRCQVREISSGRLSLDFQNVVDETATLERLRLDLEGRAASIGEESSRLVDLIFAQSGEAVFDMEIDRWLVRCVEGNFQDEAHAEAALECIRSIDGFCLYVLEDSPMLRSLKPEELQTMQGRLGKVAALASTMEQAISLTIRGEAEAQVEQTLQKLQASGFLFDAERKLQLADYLLTINGSLFAPSITSVLDVLTKRENENLRTMQPFPRAFMRMLEHYISQSRELIDSVNTIEDSEDTQNRMANVIKALAIQQLLANGSTDVPFPLVLNRSLLYRYLSFLPGVNAQAMLEKAYRCLITEECGQLEFGWSALSSDLLIAMKVNSQGAALDAAMPQRTFSTNQVCLQLGDEVTLQPLRSSGKLKSVLPQPDFLQWHHMDVRLDTPIHIQQMQDKESLRPYEAMWKNIERHLFVFTDTAATVRARSTRTSRKRLPEEGSVVTIRVTHPLDMANTRFHCVVVDRGQDGYEGEGEIDARSVVNYKWLPDIRIFQSKEGWPLLLDAEVMHVDEDTGYMKFDLKNPINRAILDDYNDDSRDDSEKLLNYTDDYLCVVTNYSEARGTYAAVAANGLTFTFPCPDGDPNLPNSTYVMLHLLNRARMGNGMHEAEFVSVVTDRHFLTQDAVNELLLWYSCEEVWNPSEEEERDEEQTMALPEEAVAEEHMAPASSVAEFMRIVDRLAVVTSDYKQAYNYLGFLRLVALALNDQQQADYYSKRMKFILTLKYFETNGTLDEPELQEPEFMSEDVVRHYQGLHMQYLQLRCVSYMRKPQHNAELWNMVQQSSTSELSRLARLVLAYNLLGEFRQQQGQILVHKEINRLLGIKERESELRNFGEEDFHTEFKTSLVFPPDNNMRPDYKRQSENILHVICGFLNAEGGKLYLGVNNEGMGSGLLNDALSKEFNNGKNFRDAFDRRVIDLVRLRIGTEEAMQTLGEWVDANGRDVYCLTIKPSARVARIDGRCWRRVGTESVELKGETMHRFMEQRATEMRSAAYAAPDSAEEAVLASAAGIFGNDSDVAASQTPAFDEPHEPAPSSLPSIRGAVYPHYEGAYAKGYVNIIDREHYMHTEDDHPYLGRARISIPVYEGMSDPHIVLVYTDGTALRVPVDHIFSQQERRLFSLYKTDADIAFAAIMDEDDLLLTVRRDRRGHQLSRCDSMDSIELESSLNSRGQSLVNEGIGEFVTCALINEHQGEFRRIRNLARTSLGSDLTAKSYTSMRSTLEQMGLAYELGL